MLPDPREVARGAMSIGGVVGRPVAGGRVARVDEEVAVVVLPDPREVARGAMSIGGVVGRPTRLRLRLRLRLRDLLHGWVGFLPRRRSQNVARSYPSSRSSKVSPDGTVAGRVVLSVPALKNASSRSSKP